MVEGVGHIQSILMVGLAEKEKKFLEAIVEWRGWKSIKAQKSASLAKWKDLPEKNDSILLWDDPGKGRVEELLEEGWEILAVGRLSSEMKKEWIHLGLARLWENMEELYFMPLTFPYPSERSLLVWIFTGDIWLDRVLISFFRSHGIRVIHPMEINHLFIHLKKDKPDLVLLDWDHALESSLSFFSELERFSESHTMPVFLGCKDYDKQGLSQDLIKKISKYSTINFPKNRLLSSLVYSFMGMERDDLSKKDTMSLVWDLPIRGKLRKMDLISIQEPGTLQREDEWKKVWRWFTWWKDESFH